jgi:hypothetical protein
MVSGGKSLPDGTKKAAFEQRLFCFLNFKVSTLKNRSLLLSNYKKVLASIVLILLAVPH